MSQLMLNPLQQVNLPTKPYIHNVAQDRYWGLGGLSVFHWKRKKSMQQAIVYFNFGKEEKSDMILANQKKENSEEHNYSY